MEKQLQRKNIPFGYKLCFNEACQLREKCMHYQAYLLQSKERLSAPAILPSAWQDGQCQCYCEDKMVKKAWGFSNIYNNVPNYQKAEASEGEELLQLGQRSLLPLPSWREQTIASATERHHGDTVRLRQYRRIKVRPLRNGLRLCLTILLAMRSDD
jgi:hypothetical protein